MRALFVILLLTSLCLPSAVSAAVQTITATHTYVMGDNDSKNDARRMCFLEAKRKVLEKAGTFIESSTEVKNFQLSKDQLTSYAAAVLSVETVNENFSSNNGQNAVTMTVKANVDTTDVQKQLTDIVANKGLQEKIAAQQQQLKQLEEQMRAVNAKLAAAPPDNSTELRRERNVVLGNIQELESKKLAAAQRITAKSDLIRQYIVRNMTEGEVIGFLGQPQIKTKSGLGHPTWFYGEIWICFDQHGLVRSASLEAYCPFGSEGHDELTKNHPSNTSR